VVRTRRRHVTGCGRLKADGRDPETEAGARPLLPGEGPGRNRLAEAIHGDRAMRGRAAEGIAPGRLPVATGSGIDQETLSERSALDAQQVGVAMARAERAAERADVEDQLV